MTASPEAAKKPVICPYCGLEGSAGELRCGRCGAPFDLDTRRALGLERVRHQRVLVASAFMAATLWWFLALLGNPTVAGILVPASVVLMAFAEAAYLTKIAPARIENCHAGEMASASVRLASSRAASEDAPAAADDDGTANSSRPGEAPSDQEEDRESP